jgi:hypothetical protein
MKQLSIFECSAYMNHRTIKEILNLSADKSGLSREAIAIKMNEIAIRFGISLTSSNNGGELSEAVLIKWLTVNDKENRTMPIHALPIFCKVVGDTTVLEAVLKPFGFSIIGPEEQKKLAWAEANLTIKHQRKKIRKLEEDLS